MLFRRHKNTVRNWLKVGLQPVDNRRPILILGRELSRFLHARREHARQRCRPGQLYCVRCRAPKLSGGGTGRLRADHIELWKFQGTAADCGTRMYRRVAWRKLTAVAGDLQVQLPQAQQRIADTAAPSSNCDLAAGSRCPCRRTTLIMSASSAPTSST